MLVTLAPADGRGILRYSADAGDRVYECSAHPQTTNNCMELTAATEGLGATGASRQVAWSPIPNI